MNNQRHFAPRPTSGAYRQACDRQAELDAQKAAFFAAGGKITPVPTGQSGLAEDGLGHRGRYLKSRNRKGVQTGAAV